MAKSNSQKVKVGLFVVVGTALLIAALYFIGNQKYMFTKNFELYAVFENVNGLQLGNNVRYSGINVGTVSKIEMTKVGMITIQMSVEEKTANFIKKDAIASISSDGLVGSMVVNIIPGNDEHPKSIVSGDTIRSNNKISTDEMIAILNTTNNNAALLSVDLLKITNQILNGNGTLSALINDTIMTRNVQQTVLELKRVSENTSLAISKVNQIISKIDYDKSAAAVVLSDTAAANQIKNIFANLGKSSEDINMVTKNLNAYLNEIKSGKGALNHITQDKNLVRDIDSTMIEIKEAADKLNQIMDALKHNIIFRRYFRKLENEEN